MTHPDARGPRPRLRAALLAAGAAAAALAASPGLALALGAALALTLGNPFPAHTARASRWLLQASVVGLGFGMSLAAVLEAGASGIGYTVAGIAAALALGTMLGRWLRVEPDTSLLITAGTSICGGSAIAAVAPVIGAGAETIAVALGTVFVLNGAALYLFPLIGGWLELGQGEFAVWAAVAIHDTSSVVGAAASYGEEALEMATVLKLARALWILPLALGTALVVGRRRSAAGPGVRAPVAVPWFIGLFVLAALARTTAPAAALPLLDAASRLARLGLVLTLFLIGLGLTRATLGRVGARPLVQGILLWAALAGLSLIAVLWRGVA